MKVAFVLPKSGRYPVGGYKVVYEYANRLVERGHEVSVLHPWRPDPPRAWRERLQAMGWLLRYSRRRKNLVPWFELDPRIELPTPVYLRADRLPRAEAIIATAWHTAPIVAAATTDGDARGFYLIQHFEDWDESDAVLETWRLPLQKIVIAHWLEEIAVKLGEGERTTWIPNGLDSCTFGLDVPPAQRPPRVGALISPFKGAADVIAALEGARERVPELSAGTYGAWARPAELPDWVDYVRLPSPQALRALYNSCSIFLQASRSEGWGLPATEAMACGAALVTYDNGGSREYAIEGETATVVAEHGAELLCDAIVDLVIDRSRRLAYAERGRKLVEGFTWPRAVTELERVLEG